MSKQTISGFAVIGPKWMGKGFEVKGIGQQTCEAWSDASFNVSGGRVPSRDMPKEYIHLKCVEAKITVTF